MKEKSHEENLTEIYMIGFKNSINKRKNLSTEKENTLSNEELITQHCGQKGTKKRDEFEMALDFYLNSYKERLKKELKKKKFICDGVAMITDRDINDLIDSIK